jgi:hypothetical protein
MATDGLETVQRFQKRHSKVVGSCPREKYVLKSCLGASARTNKSMMDVSVVVPAGFPASLNHAFCGDGRPELAVDVLFEQPAQMLPLAECPQWAWALLNMHFQAITSQITHARARKHTHTQTKRTEF